MTTTKAILSMIAASSLVAFGIRYLPMLLARGQRLPRSLERFLGALPIGILSALVAQAVFLRAGVLDSGVSNYYLHGFVGALLIAVLTRSLAAVVFGSLAVVGLLTFVGLG